jgi:phosphate starvation-inducible PhoH-like protein
VFDQDIIVKGVNGKVIKAKTTNLKKLVKETEKKIWFLRSDLPERENIYKCSFGGEGFKDKQVKRIVLTRPAVEAGRVWVFAG